MKDLLIKTLRDLVQMKKQWIDLDSRHYSGYKSTVTSTGTFNDINSCDELDEFKLSEEETEKFHPFNIFNLEPFNIDISGSKINGDYEDHKKYVKTIDEDLDIVINIRSGTINGVGFNKGYEIFIGIRYCGITAKIYHFKQNFEDKVHSLNCLFDKYLFEQIDLSDMKKVTQYRYNISEYDIFSEDTKSCKVSSKPNYEKYIQLFIEDGVMIVSYETGSYVIGREKDHRSINFPRNILDNANVHTIFFKDRFCFSDYFDIPKSLKKVTYDSETKRGYLGKLTFKDIVDRDPKLSKYLGKDLQKKAKKRKEYNKLMALRHKDVNIEFNYLNLHGIVQTNEYALSLFKEFYKDKEEVVLSVAGQSISIMKDEFDESFTIVKKELRGAKKKAFDTLGSRIGYIDWWKDEFGLYPKE